MIANKKKGIYFFITGFSGAGKSSIAKKIKKKIEKKYGPTILIHGDELRKIFNFNSYTKESRKTIALYYSKLSKKLIDNNINVILATVSLFSKIRKWNRENIDNYVEIYIKASFKKIIKRKQKYFYRKKVDNVIGIKIKPELPIKSDIVIYNNFKTDLNNLSNKLLTKIFKYCKKNKD